MNDKRFSVWKPLTVGARVRSLTYRRGEQGVVVERLDDEISGMARYGIKLDSNFNVADFCRYELSKVK